MADRVLGYAIVAFVLLAPCRARDVSVGDLYIPYSADNGALSINPYSSPAMPGSCISSASADFGYRSRLAQYSSTSSSSSWGPHLNWYPVVTADQVPSQCNPTAWAWQRVLAAISMTQAMDINYCHHHAPGWVTTSMYQVWCDPTEPGVDLSNCVCNKAGSYKANAWRGLDCSNYVAWIYNFAFGFYPSSAIGSLACSSDAPGRILDSVSTSNLNSLNPGDLLFITLGRSGKSPPVRVSHVVIWTGWQVNFSPRATGPLAYKALLANLPPNQLRNVQACVAAQRAKGLPIYVISDSTYTGPNLRPFCGWYMSSFSHARRIINPDGTQYLNQNNGSVAVYSPRGGDCMSYWALSSPSY